jgi:hypothetical protein
MACAAVTKPALDHSANGDLVIPVNFHRWVHLRLSDEPIRHLVDLRIVTNYPDAYVEPMAYENFLSTNVLPEGIIAFKKTGKGPPIMGSGLADRGCKPCSDFSDIECADIAVKDSLVSDEIPGWRFFRLNY